MRHLEWSVKPLTLGCTPGPATCTSTRSSSAGFVGAVQHAASASNSWAWADPLIGVRWEVPVLDRLSLDFRGDIGGFGASSDLIWGLVSDVKYWLPWTPWALQPWFAIGYRAVAFNRDFAGSNNIDLQFRGPTRGAGFVF